ncbi:MAG: M6 family metalloprotease domain-containing protein [Thermoanaerobaculaceae bacterium]|nr:M6 family metalloprotease domain-containing protein [Thermoanaerobaculaceae bacterium]
MGNAFLLMDSSWQLRERLGWLAWGVATLLLGVGLSGAAYLENVPQTLEQPDGTLVECFASGDEFYHWLHDADGFVIIRDPQSWEFVYADKVDGRLVPTPCRAGSCDPRTVGLQPNLRPDPAFVQARVARMAVPEPAGAPQAAPRFSTLTNLVIFVRFADQTEFPTSLATYEQIHNAPEGNSVYAYFKEASYGRTLVSSAFFPVSTGSAVVSYQDPNPRGYYLPKHPIFNSQGYEGDDQRVDREMTLIANAVAAIAPQVPPSLPIDTNSDGRVDLVTLIVRGSADSSGDILWPHRWVLQGKNASINGKAVYEFNFELETMVRQGVLSHEITHSLGAPDLYHYTDCSSKPSFNPVWKWDLMATTNYSIPVHTGAYVKQRYLGFIDDIPTIRTSGRYTLNPITSPTNNAYKIVSPYSDSEWFVLEYRHAVGTFESALPTSGLLVYRINPRALPAWDGNRCGPPDKVYIYRPGGSNESDGTPAKAPLAADHGRITINDYTDPPSYLTDGTFGGLSIFDVSEVGDTLSFSVAIAPCAVPGLFELSSPDNGATVASASSVTLSWAASTGASSYRVYVGTSAIPPLAGETPETTLTVPVTPGTTYYWRVVATNACGQVASPVSTTRSFTVDISNRHPLRQRIRQQPAS